MDIFKDIEKKYNNEKNYANKFKIMAEEILNKFELYIKDKIYNIEEIEIYFRSSEHDDVYVHCSDNQLTKGEWYFHKFKSGAYKGGTYKGLDMTFGDENKKEYGGILIRSISSDDDFITGPSNVVTHIMSKIGKDSVSDTVKSLDTMEINNKKNPFHIKYDISKEKTKTVFSGPRVGLSFRSLEYTFIEYRFLTNPHKIPKYRSTIITKLHKDKLDPANICLMTKIKEDTIKKYIDEFELGKKENYTKNDMNVNKINKLYGWYNK